MLLLLIPGEVALAVAATWWLWYRDGQQAIAEVEGQLVQEVSDAIAERLGALLSEPLAVGSLIKAGIELGFVDTVELAANRPWLTELVTIFPEASYALVGTTNGDYVGVERLLDGSLVYEVRDASTGGAMDTIPMEPDGRLRLDEKRSRPAFDGTQRPWWRAAVRAGGKTWTQPYVYFSMPPRMGITMVEPFFDPSGELVGVLGSDLVLPHIDAFLETLHVGRTGCAFLLERSGRLIASSTGVSAVRDLGGEVERVPLMDHPDPMLRGAALALREQLGAFADLTEPIRFRATVAGDPALIEAWPVQGVEGLDWLAVVVLPQADYMGDVAHDTRRTLWVFGGVLLLAAVTVLATTRRLALEIGKVREQMGGVAQLRFGDAAPEPSRLTEVRRMQEGLLTMTGAMQAFGRYVPREVVRRVVADRGGARLEVQPGEVTVAMMDLAGFTSMAERLDDDALVAVLEPWFDQMSAVLRAHDATIDKYIGDAILALFNAPSPVPDHPVRACEAALACQARLDEVSQVLQGRGLPALAARIGVHTGFALVGNVGAPDRLNYTALGAPVVVAESLEAANKHYGTRILVSSVVFAAVAPEVLCRPVDRVRLDGQRGAEVVYEVLGMRTSASSTDHARALATTEAFARLQRGDTVGAAAAYRAIVARFGADALAARMADRCGAEA